MTQASGGIETTYQSGVFTYRAFTFTTSGTFTVTEGGKVECLVVAGGGSGGSYVGGGGGAGGVLTRSITLGPQTYSIVVGAGAAGAGSASVQTKAVGNDGQPSSAFGFVAAGGGGAGFYPQGTGRPGGSGGGSGGFQDSTGSGGAGTAQQGNDGGSAVGGRPRGFTGGGGGGGAGAAGGTSTNAINTGGDGGAGIASNFRGTVHYYGGGGGGGNYDNGARPGNGGIGGGGGGTSNTANTSGVGGGSTWTGLSGGTGSPTGDPANYGGAGAANTGGGGGGNGHYGLSGAGGSGVVIVRYVTVYTPVAITLTKNFASVTLDRNTPNLGTTPISADGGLGTLYYTISPNLPTGLQFNALTGQITGRPVAAMSPTTYTVRVTDDSSLLSDYAPTVVTDTFDLTTTTNPPAGITSNGGTVSTYTQDGQQYQVHTFTSAGNFTLSGAKTVDIMSVAGGGGGGGHVGGGGGGGGVVVGQVDLNSGTYAVTVGAGGTGANVTNGGVVATVSTSGGDSGLLVAEAARSFDFDGEGDYLTIVGGAGLAMGTGNFTLEAWVCPIAWTVEFTTVFSTRATNGASAVEWAMGVHNSGYPYVYSNAFQVTGGAGQVVLGKWTHLAVARSGSTMTLYVNGAAVATAASQQDYTTTSAAIGANRNGTEQWTGYISNLRLVKGTAIYSRSFAASLQVSPVSAISGTTLLTARSATFVDTSASAFAITVNGNPTTSIFNPYYATASVGGGRGASYQQVPGWAGGSGGGGGGGDSFSTAAGLGILGQGFNGGAGSGASSYSGGGGGGAGAVGSNGTGSSGGAGGIGRQLSITGTAAYYAGGGGGGQNNSDIPGLGGQGGGGGGSARTGSTTVGSVATSGTVNTGGGGGGSGQGSANPFSRGGSGGSGIVVIRYAVGPAPLTHVRTVDRLPINKFDFKPTAPVIPAGGTEPYSYTVSPTLPEGLLLGTGNGVIYGTPTVTVDSSVHTITVTDSSATPRTTANTVNISTNLSYLYNIDLVANEMLTITTEYGILDSERRSASISSPGLQVLTFDVTAGARSLYYGNVISISSTSNVGYNLGLVSEQAVTSVDSGFENYLTLNGNLKTVYGNVRAEVSNFYLNDQTFSNVGTYSWTVPAGVTSITVAGVGGGGGGSQKSTGGTGGGGGQLTFVNNVPVTPGDTYTVVVGAGGNTGGAYALSGGDTYMYKTTGNTAPILLASGGRGGDGMYWKDNGITTSIFSNHSGTIYDFAAISPVGQTITYSISSGSLPSGVTLSSGTGILSGDPADPVSDTNYPFVVLATTSSQAITKNFNLVVKPQTLGLVSTNPAPSIAAIRAAGFTTDGSYWFSTAKQATPFQAYVRFNYIDGGDWALLLKVHNQGDMPSGSSAWTNTTLNNATDFNLTSGNWSKYATWNGIAFTRLMMVMTQGGVPKVPPIMIFNTSRTFAEAIALAGGATAANGYNNVVKANSTDPALGVSATYLNMTMKSGTAFTDPAGVEDVVQAYGIGMWGNNSNNSTTAEGFASTGRAGAWIGCPLDEGAHTFNNDTNTGSDSAFGFGFAAGNPAKTGSAGYAEWTNASSTNTLPGYVWVR